MNKFFFLLSFMLCLVIASCDDEHNANIDDDGEETATPFWEHSHLTFAGLKGDVIKVIETSYSLSEEDETEPATLLDMSFNAAGQMTYYNSTGMEPVTRGVWLTMAYYSYQYDDNGRMIQATVTPVGDVPIVYHLTYGEHAQYIPLIFPLGAMDFFLVKGLQSITSEDGATSYTFDGGKAAYKQEAWMGDTETVYFYAADSSYPEKKVVTTSRNGVVLNEETTLYTYGEEGRLLKKDVRTMEDGTETERTITNYADVDGQLLFPVSFKMDLNGFMADWTYAYDADNRLQQIDYIENKGSEDEATDKEEYHYLVVDSNGNWTDSKQLRSSRVDLSHTDGTIGVRRVITYQ